MKRFPQQLDAYQLHKEWTDPNAGRTDVQVQGKWVPARCLGYASFFSRVRLAWAVYKGRADALFWKGQGDKDD